MRGMHTNTHSTHGRRFSCLVAPQPDHAVGARRGPFPKDQTYVSGGMHGPPGRWRPPPVPKCARCTPRRVSAFDILTQIIGPIQLTTGVAQMGLVAPDHAEGGGSAQPRGAGGRPASAHTASGTRQRTGMGTHVDAFPKMF